MQKSTTNKSKEFTHSKFWIHEGILHHQFHTNVQTYESILKHHEFFKSLGVAQKPQPVIVDYRSLTKMINKVRDYYLENTEIFNKYSAIAMICDHPSNDAIVQFFLVPKTSISHQNDWYVLPNNKILLF